jgi:hypothetical protein
MKPYLFMLAIVSYLCSVFYSSKLLDIIISLSSLIIVISVFPTVKRFVQGMGSIFLLIGVLLLFLHGSAWTNYFYGFGNMLKVLSLFALIPIISIPIVLGNYAIRIQAMIQSKIKDSAVLYMVTSGMAYILSSFMSLATLPMIYRTIRPSLDMYPIEHKERFISRAITHGYSMPIVWTPVAPIVGIIIEMTGVRWSSILPIVIPFSLVGLVLDMLIGKWNANHRPNKMNQTVSAEVSAARESMEQLSGQKLGLEKSSHPLQILLAILIFNGLILILEEFSSFSFLLLVTVSVIPFAVVWSLLLGKGKLFVVESKSMLHKHLLGMKEQFFIFLSAGFMISAIQSTGAGHSINLGLIVVKDFVGADVFLLIIPLIPFALAFIGIHPAVGLALVAEALNPKALGISVEITAIAMLVGATMAFMMGPYNATTNMTASLSGKSSYQVSNWNAPFTLLYLLLSMLLLLLLKNVRLT